MVRILKRPARRRIKLDPLETIDRNSFDWLNTEWQCMDGASLLTSHEFATVAEFREQWDFHKSWFLPEWIAERPGTRPFAWWLFDAPSRHIRRPRNQRERHWGVLELPNIILGSPEALRGDHPEIVYLRKHGLLTDAEVKALQEGKTT